MAPKSNARGRNGANGATSKPRRRLSPSARCYAARKPKLAISRQPILRPRKTKKPPESPEPPESPGPPESSEPPESSGSPEDVYDDIPDGEPIVLDRDVPQEVEGPETDLGPAPHLTEKWYNNPLIVGSLQDWHQEIVSLRRPVHLQTLIKFWPDVQASVSVIRNRNFYQTVDWMTLDAETRAMMETWTPKAKKYVKAKPAGQYLSCLLL